jgi:hypothetical protein
VKRYLLIALSVAFTVLNPITDSHSAGKNPKFTLIFERSKEISCAENQENITIDFTNYYTSAYERGIDSNKKCRFSISPSKQNFSVAKDNGLLKVHPQVFENNSWIRMVKSQINVSEGQPWGYPLYEMKKAGKDGRFRLHPPIRFPFVDPPISEEYKAKGYSHFFGLKAGSFCLEQTPGPLKIRFEIVNGKTTYFSNAVSLLYVNYDKILYNGYNCYSTSGIVKPESNGSAQNSQPAMSTSSTSKSALKPCTTNEKLVLTQIDRQYLAASLNYSDNQKKIQKLDQDFQYASVLGNANQMNNIKIEIDRVQSNLNTLGKSMDNLTNERKKILAKCDPKSKSNPSKTPTLKQCTQSEISLIRSFASKYDGLMRQYELARSEITLQQERIGGLMLQGRMEEIARANFIIEEQSQYAGEASAQAAYVKKQFETANSACLNSGITL